MRTAFQPTAWLCKHVVLVEQPLACGSLVKSVFLCLVGGDFRTVAPGCAPSLTRCCSLPPESEIENGSVAHRDGKEMTADARVAKVLDATQYTTYKTLMAERKSNMKSPGGKQ